MKRRILAGMGANSFGMSITIGIQLVSLPLFLNFWDTATYGVWLMLSAIPAYLSMADVGMVTAAGNRMTMAMGKGDATEANRVFQSAQLFMAVVCGGLALLVVPAVLLVPLPGLDDADRRMALLALSLGVLIALFGGLSEAVFKSTSRYAQGTMLANFIRLGEWGGMMLGLALWQNFAAVALMGLAARLIGTAAGMLLAVKGDPAYAWGMRAARLAEIRAMLKPAASFMAFPLGNALSFQGVTLLVGVLFGPAAVALFNTYRTIARVAVQVTAIFSHALWPEFSRLFGHGGTGAVHRLFLRSAWLSAAQAVGVSMALYLLAPWLLDIWTHGRIGFAPELMLLMLLYAVAGGLWHVPRVLLMATNQHGALALWSLAAGALSVGLTWALGSTLGIDGVGVAMLASELFIVVACTLLAYGVMSRGLQKQGAPA